MKVHYECAPCFLRQAREAMDLITDDDDLKVSLMEDVFELLSKEYYVGANSNYLGSKIHRLIKTKTNSFDPYKTQKVLSNEMALEFLPEAKKVLDGSLESYVKISIIGNMIDFGAFQLDEDIKSLMENALNNDLKINDVDKLEDALKKYDNVLYLVDNTGEIVFDKLLLEKIKEYDVNITLAVKEKPIVNDACMEDAIEVGLDEYADIVSTGEDTVGLVYCELSPEFKEIFDNSDFIISKGLGNFEGLTEMDLFNKDVFYLACAKCPATAKMINVGVNDMFLLKN
ncbi:MAG: damage-control phosphatase ARMT1 family protein [Methanobrevibacter sp.]